MMGILYTESLVDIVSVVVLFQVHFIQLIGSFCRGVPFMVFMERL